MLQASNSSLEIYFFNRKFENQTRLFSTEEITDTTILKSIAEKRPDTTKPGTIFPKSIIKSPLRIRRNIPRVNIVRGRVRITNTGFIKEFITAINTATIRSVSFESISIPGIIFDATKTEAIKIRSLKIKFICKFNIL